MILLILLLFIICLIGMEKTNYNEDIWGGFAYIWSSLIPL